MLTAPPSLVSRSILRTVKPLASANLQRQPSEHRSWDSQKIPLILLPNQTKFLSHPSRVRIWRKSRRIGASWSIAGDCALNAAVRNGENSYYVGYDLQMSEQFIQDAAAWSLAYNLACSEIEEFVFKQNNEDDSILAHRIRYASGRQVIALSAKPRTLRSRQGRVVLDEFAFHDSPEQLLKSAVALLMWSKKSHIDILSSVNGRDNFFELLCTQIAQERGYYVQQTTLDDAITDGIYRRICQTQGAEWSQSDEDEWRSALIRDYGRDADEELFCKPTDISDPLFDLDCVDAQAIGAWAEPNPKHCYLLAIDPNMGGADYWCAQIWDLSTYPIQLVEQYRENYRLPSYCRAQTVKLAKPYRVIMVAIEKENGGLPVAENLAEDFPYTPIEIVSTNGLSKRLNTDRLAVALSEGDFIYPDDWAGVGELRNFSRKRREAVSGHDDCCMAAAVGWAVIETALEEVARRSAVFDFAQGAKRLSAAAK